MERWKVEVAAELGMGDSGDGEVVPRGRADGGSGGGQGPR
jgi:hypothetical protein